MKEFDSLSKHAVKILKNYYDENLVITILRETREEYENLIPKIPYIGGKDNSNTNNLILSTAALALYKVMKTHGKTVENCGKIIYETIEAQLNSYPKFLLRLLHKLGLSPFTFKARNSMMEAEKSQKRQYAEDWVSTYVEGDMKNFNWGIDYFECAIIKFFKTQDVEELTQFICPCDFPITAAFGVKLKRTMTLAEGAVKCDYRFK